MRYYAFCGATRNFRESKSFLLMSSEENLRKSANLEVSTIRKLLVRESREFRENFDFQSCTRSSGIESTNEFITHHSSEFLWLAFHVQLPLLAVPSLPSTVLTKFIQKIEVTKIMLASMIEL